MKDVFERWKQYPDVVSVAYNFAPQAEKFATQMIIEYLDTQGLYISTSHNGTGFVAQLGDWTSEEQTSRINANLEGITRAFEILADA